MNKKAHRNQDFFIVAIKINITNCNWLGGGVACSIGACVGTGGCGAAEYSCIRADPASCDVLSHCEVVWLVAVWGVKVVVKYEAILNVKI